MITPLRSQTHGKKGEKLTNYTEALLTRPLNPDRRGKKNTTQEQTQPPLYAVKFGERERKTDSYENLTNTTSFMYSNQAGKRKDALNRSLSNTTTPLCSQARAGSGIGRRRTRRGDELPIDATFLFEVDGEAQRSARGCQRRLSGYRVPLT